MGVVASLLEEGCWADVVVPLLEGTVGFVAGMEKCEVVREGKMGRS